MFPRVTVESFERLDNIEIDGQKFKTFALLPVPSPGSSPWKIGPKGQLFDRGVQHAIRLLVADVDKPGAASPSTEKVAWMWAHVIRKNEEDSITIDKYVYSSLEECVYETNLYLLGWVLRSNLVELWAQRYFPCYVDNINHMIDFSQINPATVVLTDEWNPEDVEIKTAIAAFERYISSGLFVKICGMLSVLDMKKNPYKIRLEDDFKKLAKSRLETFL